MCQSVFNSLDLDEVLDLVEQYDLYIQHCDMDECQEDNDEHLMLDEFYVKEYSEGIRYE